MGLGLFMAPDNDATLSAAAASYAGTASAMLSLLRVLGSCVGISSVSSVMSWRMEAMAGSAGQDVFLAGHPLLEAVWGRLGPRGGFPLFPRLPSPAAPPPRTPSPPPTPP